MKKVLTIIFVVVSIIELILIIILLSSKLRMPMTNWTPTNDKGVLVIDNIIEAKLGSAPHDSDCLQEVVNNPDLACIWDEYGVTYIADHKEEYFKDLKKVEVGSTAHYLNKDLVCIEVTEGHVSNGRILVDGKDTSIYKDKVIMYTCIDNTNRIVTIGEVE